MGVVMSFPGQASSINGGAHPVADDKTARSSEKDSVRDREMARREKGKTLRKDLENKHLSPDDQRIIMECIWSKISDKEVRKLVLNTAGIATKHLSNWALDPALRENRKPQERQIKNAKTFFKIINAIVKVTGSDADLTLMDIFETTSLANSSNGLPAAPEFEELARTLRAIADTVSAKHNLQDYFEKVAWEGVVLRVENELDADDIAERVADGESPLLDPDEIDLGFVTPKWGNVNWPVAFYEATREHQEFSDLGYVAPYPAVILGEWAFDSFPVTVRSSAVPAADEHGPFEGVTQGTDLVELRLCIVPVGTDMRPEAALRVWTSVSVASLRAKMPTSDDDSEDLETVRFADKVYVYPKTKTDDLDPGSYDYSAVACPSGRKIGVYLTRDRMSLPFPLSEYGKVSNLLNEARHCQYLPITGRVLEDWLSREDALSGWFSEEKPTNVRVLGEALVSDLSYAGFSGFKTGTVAAELIHCIYDTQAPLILLDDCARKFVQLFDDASAAAEITRGAQATKLEARMRAMRKNSAER